MKPDLTWKTQDWAAPDIFVVVVIFFIIATASWLSNREMEKSLRRAKKSEEELKQERDLLEVRVRERTMDLQKAQMEKMAQVHRFAEFGRLASGLFHDLVNPLTAVYLNLERMKEKSAETGELKEIESELERAQKISERMQNIITSMKKQVAPQDMVEKFSINREAEDAAQLLAYRARKNQVAIIFSAPKEIHTFGNPIKFNQIAANLIANAIDAYPKIEIKEKSGKQRKVYVDLTLQGEKTIVLTVRDEGTGIREDLLDKIFEPFFTTKAFKEGMGIGLALTKEMVEKDFNGKIQVESALGKGSKFTVTFEQAEET